MSRDPYKIYCAGPLFNPKEREEMQEIANGLIDHGYNVFLPQEDGLEFATLFPAFIEKGIQYADAQKILNMAIFSLDVFQIINCDGLILNMNGRVPDEGAMVEAGIAWAHNKPLVIFRNDDRSLIAGNCNPLVMGLAEFYFVGSIAEITRSFDEKFAISWEQTDVQNRQFEITKENGKQISEYLLNKQPIDKIRDLLIKLFREQLCLKTVDRNVVPTPPSALKAELAT